MPPSTSPKHIRPKNIQLRLIVTSESNVASGVGLLVTLAQRAAYQAGISVLSDSSALLDRVQARLLEASQAVEFDSSAVYLEATDGDLSSFAEDLAQDRKLTILLVPGLDQFDEHLRKLLKQVHTTVVCFEAHPGLESRPENLWLLGEDYRYYGAWFGDLIRSNLTLQPTTPEQLQQQNVPAVTQSEPPPPEGGQSADSVRQHEPSDWVLLSTDSRGEEAAVKQAKQTVDIAIGPVLLIRGKAAWMQLLFEQQLPALAARYIPQMERSNRQELATKLQTFSRLDFEFLALICASTFLASFGLLQNSAAVIIGAMLVAPLMTPLLGAGLSLANGNRPLFVRSLKTIGIGFCAALATSFLFGVLVRFLVPSILALNEQKQLVLTDEMWSRTHPTAIDLLVGLVGGSAAAFARTRAHLADALAGAAIAAALVPPVATAGLHLAFLGLTVAPQSTTSAVANLFFGPVILFVANVLTIILGSSFVLWGCGLRGNHHHSTREQWTTLVTALLMMFAAAVLLWLFQNP